MNRRALIAGAVLVPLSLDGPKAGDAGSIHAAIARWRPLWDAYMAACDIEDEAACDDAVSKTIDPAHAALGDVYRAVPRTPAELLALMNVMLEADGDHLRLFDAADEDDDAGRGLKAVFHHARRLTGAMQ